MAGRVLQRACAWTLVALVVCAAAGCGGNDPERETLSGAERAQVVRTKRAIAAFCRQVGLFLSRRRGPTTEEELGEATAEIDRLVAIARSKPNARLDELTTMSDVVGDLAEGLEASNCSPALEARLEQALGSGP
jgi:hypothetical protein